MKLNISSNKIGKRGIWSLAANCSNLQELNLSHNGITSDGLPAVLDVMTNYCRLKELSFNFNSIGIKGAASLEGWKHSSVLTVFLNGCIGSSHESSLLDGGEHPDCDDCGCLLQLYQFNDSIVIVLDLGRRIPTLVCSDCNQAQ